MRFPITLVVLLLVPMTTACMKGPVASTVDSPVDTASSQSEMAPSVEKDVVANDSNIASAGNLTTEPEMDYGDWLQLPEGIDRRLADVYPTLVRSTIGGDPGGQANLAMISQQIAITLTQSGKPEDAYPFLIQSGKALRLGLSAGSQQINPMVSASIFFNEACALSKSGKPAEAIVSLEDAIANGFSNLSSITSDEDLAALRESDEFAKKFQQWESAIAEKMVALVDKEMSTFETFPFTFAATDISGKEQSSEALAGKVVIVDFWGTWCPPCRAEIPSFIKLQEAYGEQGLQLVGLNYERKNSEEENLKAVVDFVTETGINYPCIMGDNATRAQVPEFQGYPTTLFIDKTGRVRLKAVGLHDYAYLEAIVKRLLAE